MENDSFLDNDANANFMSTPRVASLENNWELLQLLMDSLEQGSGELFQVSTTTADLNVLRGHTSVFLTPEEETLSVMTEGASSTVEVTGGEHDILLSSGVLNLSQTEGSTVLYIDDFFDTEAEIEIISGTMKVLINDPAIELGVLSFVDGYIEVNGQQTGIFFSIDEAQENALIIENMIDGTELRRINSNVYDGENVETMKTTENGSSDEATASIEQSSSAHIGTPNDNDFLFVEDTIIEVLDGDLLIASSTPMNESFNAIDFSSGLYSDLSFELQDHFTEHLELELNQLMTGSQTQEAIENLLLPSPDSSVANLDRILEMESYGSLEWENAVEIIEDL